MAQVYYHWKGVCHGIFDLYFFMIRTHLGPWYNRVKYFRIQFRIRREIRSQSSKNSIPRCDAHRGVSKKFEYLDEIETEFENTLPSLSGAQMGSNHEKIEVENLVTHSL